MRAFSSRARATSRERSHHQCKEQRTEQRGLGEAKGSTFGMKVALMGHRIHPCCHFWLPSSQSLFPPSSWTSRTQRGVLTQHISFATTTDLGEPHMACDSPPSPSPCLLAGSSSQHPLPGSFPEQIIFLSKHNLRGGEGGCGREGYYCSLWVKWASLQALSMAGQYCFPGG